MKIAVYEVRDDERAALEAEAEATGAELILSSEIPGPETAALAEGCGGVSFLGQGKIDAALLDVWHAMGVSCLSTRTIGTDHIDLRHAEELGMRVCNASYAPNGVAEFTVMMMLMCLRHYKQALWRGQVNDFELEGLQGRELRNLTVGVIGTGRIGRQVIQDLSGFGCRILAYSPHAGAHDLGGAELVDLPTLLRQSDIVTLHVSLSSATYHMINRETIAQMKDGAILINSARGPLADLDALVWGIESGKLGALGIDTSEGEEGIIHADHRTDILTNRNWFYLHQFRNVIMTQHMAFYTDAAVESMVRTGIEGICHMYVGEECETRIA